MPLSNYGFGYVFGGFVSPWGPFGITLAALVAANLTDCPNVYVLLVCASLPRLIKPVALVHSALFERSGGAALCAASGVWANHGVEESLNLLRETRLWLVVRRRPSVAPQSLGCWTAGLLQEVHKDLPRPACIKQAWRGWAEPQTSALQRERDVHT